MSDDDLREFGYAPGGYASNCMDCDLPLMFVDKRCRVCRDCAIKRRNAKAVSQKGIEAPECGECGHPIDFHRKGCSRDDSTSIKRGE